MEIGVLFNEEELGGGSYGMAAWTILMSTCKPKDLLDCVLFSGDVEIPADKNHRFSYCIGIQASFEHVGYFKRALSESTLKGLSPLNRRFLEGEVRRPYSLPLDGHIDGRGRLVMADTDCLWLFRVAAKCGWKYLPSDDWIGQFVVQFLMNTRVDAFRRWDDDFTSIARQALIEAGPKASMALKQYLSRTQDEEVKRVCQNGLKEIESLGKGETAKPETL